MVRGNYSQVWLTNQYLNIYQNPSWMYQINYSQIQPSGPVGHNIGPGYEGIKDATSLGSNWDWLST